ncbi:MAG: class I SAM-dependent methyltransferase [Spirochaetes bacterium]|nr:class I SAM-dependent methyltransferase [Spirochaetota bacterium]
MTKEGYPGSLVDIVDREFRGYSTVIDIGAGSGHFAIPLAIRGYRIMAIEPSEAMVKIFQKKLHTCGFQNTISISQCRWEDWTPPDFFSATNEKFKTATLCAYSIYGIKNLTSAITKMLQHSWKVVILMGNDEASTTLSGVLRKSLSLVSCAHDIIPRLIASLENLTRNYTVHDITITRRTTFTDLDAEAEYYLRHFRLSHQYKSHIQHLLLQACTQVLRDEKKPHIAYDNPSCHPNVKCFEETTDRKGYYFFDNIYRDVMVVIVNE